MKFNLKKRFKGLILAASLAAVGCNPTYAGGIGDRMMTVLGSLIAGGIIESAFRPLCITLDKFCLLFGITPRDAFDKDGNIRPEWQALFDAWHQGKSKADIQKARIAWNNTCRRGLF